MRINTLVNEVEEYGGVTLVKKGPAMFVAKDSNEPPEEIKKPYQYTTRFEFSLFFGCAATCIMGLIDKEVARKDLKEYFMNKYYNGNYITMLNDYQVDAGIGELLEEFGFKKIYRFYCQTHDYYNEIYFKDGRQPKDG